MRGKVRNAIVYFLSGRITPAYAGKSNYDVAKINDGGDHPRLCGEKNHHFCRYGLSEGSPPPMRGKAADLLERLTPTGITPAYAGKSCRPVQPHKTNLDHPRLCGEKQTNS